MIMLQDVDRALRSLHDGTFAHTEIARYFSREAFVAGISAAFQQDGEDRSAGLRDLIFANEIDAFHGRAETAKVRKIGLRTLYRRRRAALRQISGYLNERLALDAAYAEPLHVLQACRDAYTSESEYAPEFSARCRAHREHRRTGELDLLEDNFALALRLRWTLTPVETVELQIANVETAFVKGDLAASMTALRSAYSILDLLPDRRLSHRAVLAEAHLALVSGHHEQARRLTEELADAILPSDEVWAQVHGLTGRIAALDGRPWECAIPAGLNEWDTLYLHAIRARHTLLSGRCDQAENASRIVHDSARSNGFAPLAAYTAATLAMCFGSAAPESRDSWAICALRMLTACSAAPEVAYDLFRLGRSGEPPSWLSKASEKDLAEIYTCLQPASHLSAFPGFEPFVAKLVGAIVRQAARGERLPDPDLEHLIELACEAADSMHAPAAIARELEALCGLGEFLKVLWPLEHVPRYASLFNSTAQTTVRAVTRALTRRQIRALSYVS